MSIVPRSIRHPVQIVYGVYTLSGSHRGDDRWWIQRLVESDEGWMVHSDLYLDQPTTRYITLDVEMSEEWEWRYLNLRDDRGQMLAAEVAGDRLIVERNGEEELFPFDPESELGFLSPFMNSLTLRRLQLQPGETRVRHVITFDPDTFAPHIVEQRYTRAREDSTLEIGGERLQAQPIHFESALGGPPSTLLVRDDGLVLRYPELAELSFDQRASAGRGRMPPLTPPDGGVVGL